MRILYTLLILMTFILEPCAHADNKADLVVVEKSQNLLSIYKADRLLASYHAVFGGHPVGPKEMKGDGKTPEGRYIIDSKKSNSAFHKAFHISYPSSKDIARGNKLGIDPGGDVMIHGQRNGFGWASFIFQRFNWTKGCIALSNEDIDAMWDAVDSGTQIEIRP